MRFERSSDPDAFVERVWPFVAERLERNIIGTLLMDVRDGRYDESLLAHGLDELGAVPGVVGPKGGDRLSAQALELGRVPEQDPDQQSIGAVRFRRQLTQLAEQPRLAGGRRGSGGGRSRHPILRLPHAVDGAPWDEDSDANAGTPDGSASEGTSEG